MNQQYSDVNGTAVFQSRKVKGSMGFKIENTHKSDMFQINSR